MMNDYRFSYERILEVPESKHQSIGGSELHWNAINDSPVNSRILSSSYIIDSAQKKKDKVQNWQMSLQKTMHKYNE